MPLNFDVIPAIDLMDGCVVRLTRGDPKQKTVYNHDPVAVAKRWDQLGARWLHVVDLDGAFSGRYRNFSLAKAVIKRVRAKVELSGGIRTMEAVHEGLAIGAERIILGTKACQEPEFVREAVRRFGKRIAVAIDAQGQHATTSGWTRTSEKSALALAREMCALGVELLVVTDVTRDGTLSGPNIGLLEQILEVTKISAIASGGISSMSDLESLNALVGKGLKGAIVGKAIYEGRLDLAHVLRTGTPRKRQKPPKREKNG